MLVDRLVTAAHAELTVRDHQVQVCVIDLRDLPAGIGQSLDAGFPVGQLPRFGPDLQFPLD